MTTLGGTGVNTRYKYTEGVVYVRYQLTTRDVNINVISYFHLFEKT